MSYIYYCLDDNVVTDREYDRRSKELSDKMRECSEDTEYGDVFADYDGSTGFDLICRLDHERRAKVERIARFVRSLYRGQK